MSGFEVAGVVLGGIPLVIAALENYSQGLRGSLTVYEITCFDLLGPLNLPDDQLTALIDERSQKAWLDKDLQIKLKCRLGKHHDPYINLQNVLRKRIVSFCKTLKLKEDGQPPWVRSDGTIDMKLRKKFLKDLLQKTKGGFNAGQYRNTIDDIDRDIRKLTDMTNGAIRLESAKTEKKNKFQSAYWHSIRDQAQRLYDSLSSRFQPCACTHPHQANLRLDIRNNRQAEEDVARFAFLLTFENRPQPAASPPWDWRDIEIKSSHIDATGTVVAIAAPQTSTAGNRNVSFAPSVTVTVTTQSAQPSSSSPNLATRIDSLCRALTTACQREYCLGVLEDQDWQHHVYSVNGPASKARISEATSLHHIIRSKTPITARQKSTLALTLASSVLQLYDTPWLPRSWETKHIYFLKDRNGSLIPSQFYVQRTFTPASQCSLLASHRRPARNEMAYALGVALLELTHGTSILTFQKPEDLDNSGQADSMTEYMIAERLARGLNSHESENYARAAFRCVTCNFDTFASDFDDREFRAAFYQSVVVPLQKDYDYVTSP